MMCLCLSACGIKISFSFLHHLSHHQAYLDHIIQPHSTFDPATYSGLLKDKRAVVVATAGGPTLNSPMDATIPYMKQVLSFIGVQDVAVVAINGTATPAAADAIANGLVSARSAVGLNKTSKRFMPEAAEEKVVRVTRVRTDPTKSAKETS